MLERGDVLVGHDHEVCPAGGRGGRLGQRRTDLATPTLGPRPVAQQREVVLVDVGHDLAPAGPTHGQAGEQGVGIEGDEHTPTGAAGIRPGEQSTAGERTTRRRRDLVGRRGVLLGTEAEDLDGQSGAPDGRCEPVQPCVGDVVTAGDETDVELHAVRGPRG